MTDHSAAVEAIKKRRVTAWPWKPWLLSVLCWAFATIVFVALFVLALVFAGW
jgi:hypothetical protein